MDGTVVGLNLHAVSSILKFYNEDEQMFDTILLLWSIEQEVGSVL